MERIWEELAISEARIRMMDRLATHKVGFNDVEYFNLGVVYNAKMVDHEKITDQNDKKIVEVAMKYKRKDEIKSRRSLIGEKIRMRKMLEKDLREDKNRVKKILKYLNQRATRKKKEMNDKYDKKVAHLRRKFENDKEREMDKVPEEMEKYGDIAIFDEEKFDKIKVAQIQAVKYGEVELDGDEEAAMKLHPKMAMPRRLDEGYMNLAMEMSFTKVRWQIKKEEETEEKEAPGTWENSVKDQGEKDTDKVRSEQNEIEEARTRQVYDCENKTYDERKQRVTDLKECSRIFLPKPLEVRKEAQIEMRREMHARISENYRGEKCDKAGRQERNLTVEEQRGLKKLERRKNEGEIVIITTDKSSKMCVMRREDYLKLGEEHVSKDRVVDRQETLKIEKLLNQHALAWCKMWRTGEHHGHEDRIRQSKVTNSENKAELYLTYKDHKSVPGKTRPIATGCTSNTLALSSSVSTLVESLATSDENKVEVISTEDLLYNAGKHDEEVEGMRIEILRRKLKKLKCENKAHKSIESDGNWKMVGELVKNMVEEVTTKMMIKEILDMMIENLYEKEEELQLGLQDPDKEEQPGLGSSLPVSNLAQLTVATEVGGRGADHEIPWESSASREAGLLADPVVLAEVEEQEEVGGPETGAPNPPVVEDGLLRGGRALNLQGLTTHQEPVRGEGEEEMVEQKLKNMIKEMKLRYTEEEMAQRMKEECEDCNGVVEELEMCLLGLDVAALFPSMSAKRTGDIIRRRMMRSSMQIDGFDWKRGLVYIHMNRHLTGNLGRLWKILPFRRKVGGTAPGMGSRGMSGKSGSIEEQWCFKTKELTKEQKLEVVARCTEIAVRIIFENFTYNFGGKVYLQQSGGPIGERLTMACSRVVMAEWGEEYELILREAGLTVSLLRIYVDDVRQASTVLRMGTRYDVESKKMVESEEAMKEDEKLREGGETADARMARVLAPAMNSINPDLTFTTELREDFSDRRLPTLDCNMWFDCDWSLNHTYFEKSMRSQLMIPANSAMSEKQKMNILSNDLIRRLSNLKIEKAEVGEEQRIIDHYTTQLKTSGYDRRKAREIVVSGVLGWIRKRRRREEQGVRFYRSAASTLSGRIRRKILDPVNWFRPKDKIEEEGKEKVTSEREVHGFKKKRKFESDEKLNRVEKKQKKEDPKAVMFCPYTPGGELAKRLREVEFDMEKSSGYKIKIVEESGEKVLDVLHSSNPWKGEDCGREKCML